MTAGADLTAFNTLRVPARAERLLVIRDVADLQALAGAAVPPIVLGGGSNVVLRRHLAGTVCLIRLRGVRVDPGGGGVSEVTAAAGENWHELVRFCLGRGLAGIENLALIPGSVGAAPIQNIGAYGVELADRFVRLRAMHLGSGETRTFTREDCQFGYRHSLFKTPAGAGWVVVDVTLRLRARAAPVLEYPDLREAVDRLGWSMPTPVQVAEAVIRVRRRKLPDPARIGNAGSFFKNPELPEAAARALQQRHPGLSLRPGSGGRLKLSAAQLIDACGWKGHRRGAVAVWHRQPLVLVH
ncbi:MAG: UDP-N-acetylmuramate dehydrogenase, partial [Pseudomonadales bacterium]